MPAVPESVLKKRRREEQWALAKKEKLQEAKVRNAANRRLIFKKAEGYAKEYKQQVGAGPRQVAHLRRENACGTARVFCQLDRPALYDEHCFSSVAGVRLRGAGGGGRQVEERSQAQGWVLCGAGGEVVVCGPHQRVRECAGPPVPSRCSFSTSSATVVCLMLAGWCACDGRPQYQ